MIEHNKILQFDYEKINEIVKETGLYYKQPENVINKELVYVENELLPTINEHFYIKDKAEFVEYIENYKSDCIKLFDRYSKSIRQYESNYKNYDNIEIFSSAYLLKIYDYVLSLINHSSQQKQFKQQKIIKLLDFIDSCKAVISNCELDIIKKATNRNFNLEQWQKRSFLYNKQFKTGSKYWRENQNEIRKLQQSCKSDLLLYFFELNVTEKDKIYKTIIFLVNESINNINNFAKKYNLTDCNILPNVFFIFDMQQLNIELKEWIEKTLQYYSGKKQQTLNKAKQKMISYVWQNNPDTELPKLFKQMINIYKLIASDTTFEQFEAIFTGQPIESIKPIKWEDQTVLLAYFIAELRTKNKVSIDVDLWAIAEKCFQDTKRKTLANAYNNSLNNKNKTHKDKPKQHKIIDDIFDNL